MKGTRFKERRALTAFAQSWRGPYERLVCGKAFVVPLLNPLEVIEGKEARFDGPIDVDLDGYGIRSIEARNKKEYLIVAGPYHENSDSGGEKREESRLYLWSGKASESAMA